MTDAEIVARVHAWIARRQTSGWAAERAERIIQIKDGGAFTADNGLIAGFQSEGGINWPLIIGGIITSLILAAILTLVISKTLFKK